MFNKLDFFFFFFFGKASALPTLCLSDSSKMDPMAYAINESTNKSVKVPSVAPLNFSPLSGDASEPLNLAFFALCFFQSEKNVEFGLVAPTDALGGAGGFA
jgi:hypothetical protein